MLICTSTFARSSIIHVHVTAEVDFYVCVLYFVLHCTHTANISCSSVGSSNLTSATPPITILIPFTSTTAAPPGTCKGQFLLVWQYLVYVRVPVFARYCLVAVPCHIYELFLQIHATFVRCIHTCMSLLWDMTNNFSEAVTDQSLTNIIPAWGAVKLLNTFHPGDKDIFYSKLQNSMLNL